MSEYHITATSPSGIQSQLNARRGDSSAYRIDQSIRLAIQNMRPAIASDDGLIPANADPVSLLAEFASNHEHDHPWSVGTSQVHGKDDRSALFQRWAAHEQNLQVAAHGFRSAANAVREQVHGSEPVRDASGNVMPTGTADELNAAWQRRKELYNTILCHGYNHVSMQPELQRRLLALAAPELSADPSVSKQQLLTRFNRAVQSRSRYLFDGLPGPSNSQQRAAVDSMLAIRQRLMRSLRSAATTSAAELATASSINEVNGVTVDTSIGWTHGSGEPILHGSHSAIYTKGSGSSKWKLAISAHTSASSDALSLAAGEVLLDDFTHPDFEVTGMTNRASDGDLSFTVRRKGAGHPAAGTYNLELTARNLRGPSTIQVAISVK